MSTTIRIALAPAALPFVPPGAMPGSWPWRLAGAPQPAESSRSWGSGSPSCCPASAVVQIPRARFLQKSGGRSLLEPGQIGSAAGAEPQVVGVPVPAGAVLATLAPVVAAQTGMPDIPPASPRIGVRGHVGGVRATGLVVL